MGRGCRQQQGAPIPIDGGELSVVDLQRRGLAAWVERREHAGVDLEDAAGESGPDLTIGLRGMPGDHVLEGVAFQEGRKQL